jgi:hypothetical protein
VPRRPGPPERTTRGCSVETQTDQLTRPKAEQRSPTALRVNAAGRFYDSMVGASRQWPTSLSTQATVDRSTDSSAPYRTGGKHVRSPAPRIISPRADDTPTNATSNTATARRKACAHLCIPGSQSRCALTPGTRRRRLVPAHTQYVSARQGEGVTYAYGTCPDFNREPFVLPPG